MTKNRYRWAAPGDVNAFFGLMLDNVADLILTVGLLAGVFGFPANFALRYMVPGTAIGVLVGDLLFFFLACYVARRTGRNDITAMPLGLDTPSTFGMVFFVLGPAFLAARQAMTPNEAAFHTWQIGICAIFISGLFKIACAFGSNWVRKMVPRAGLLGSLTAVALVLISFLPLIEVLHTPVVGLVALSILLTTLVARLPLPGRIPGALGALLVAGTLHYLMQWTGLLGHHVPPASEAVWLPREWMQVFEFGWFSVLGESLKYLPIVLPFALGTVIGGIDCTESAAAAGDEYDTGVVVGIEGFATLVAAMCGGVIQTTPYIGHPAYKAMGGRSAYVLATALFVGGAGVLGYFGLLYAYIPKPTVFPILIFIGLEITSQSFLATKRSHYPAVALACVPALAALAMLYVDNIFGDLGAITYANEAGETVPVSISSLQEARQAELQILRMLSNGFILTSLLWASFLSAVIDRNLRRAAIYLGICGLLTLFGLMHSPFPGSPAFLIWSLSDGQWESPLRFAMGYFLSGGLLWGWAYMLREGDLVGLADEEVPGKSVRPAVTATGELLRVLEPEVMDSPEEAATYDAMDHSEVNGQFVNDLVATGTLGEEVLDLGTGTARIPLLLCGQSEELRVMAVDMSVGMLDVARINLELSSHLDRVMLDRVDAKSLPYEDGRFDVVMSNSIVHHIPDPTSTFAEAARVCKPGGRLFFRDLLRPKTDDAVQGLVACYADGAPDDAKQMFDDSLRAALSLNEVRKIVGALGYPPETVQATSDRHWTWSATKHG